MRQSQQNHTTNTPLWIRCAETRLSRVDALENPPRGVDPPPIHAALGTRLAVVAQPEHAAAQAGDKALDEELVLFTEQLHGGGAVLALAEPRQTAGCAAAAAAVVRLDGLLLADAGRLV